MKLEEPFFVGDVKLLGTKKESGIEEREIGGKVISYISEVADINIRNVEDVIKAIKK